MDLLTKEQREQLLANGRANAGRARSEDFRPVVKLFCPWGAATWLLTELDPENPDIAYGLCDLGMGCPELGGVNLSELQSIRGPGGLTIERDEFFGATDPLSAYAREAERHGRILA
jgi:hypothetical protein